MSEKGSDDPEIPELPSARGYILASELRQSSTFGAPVFHRSCPFFPIHECFALRYSCCLDRRAVKKGPRSRLRKRAWFEKQTTVSKYLEDFTT
ncbi:hypothetical protein AVEN_148981-1 [Araneus ventricosus]|uniref:Uncharacterized protein n=1 Tax=Araneus ventricosus TaxID=182803 RepID=A0A4Y2V4U2_ARAVE|nr:hypothetical protein AVEN_185095-1 [Araneus ventricosus]GBO19424.1 hypothetical protein AVEN_148981-1 [Araneus ventricosus]